MHRQGKCSVIFLKLKGGERAIVSQANVGNVTLQKQCKGELLRNGVELIRTFPGALTLF